MSWGHTIRVGIYTAAIVQHPRRHLKARAMLWVLACAGAEGLDGLWYWPCGSLPCEKWEGDLCMSLWWPKPRCCGQWQNWSWLQLLCSVLSSDSPGGGDWVQSAVLLFHIICPPLPAAGSPFLPWIVMSCHLCTHLAIPRCISLLLHFLLSDLMMFFHGINRGWRNGKDFQRGEFSSGHALHSFPGSGNDRLVVDLQKLLDLEKDVGSMESCFWSKGHCILLNVGTAPN